MPLFRRAAESALMPSWAVSASHAKESAPFVVVFDRLRVSLRMPASMMQAVSLSIATPCSLNIS